MVLIVEHQQAIPRAAADPGPRSTERALRHMHWNFQPGDASALVRRRPFPLDSQPTAQEAP